MLLVTSIIGFPVCPPETGHGALAGFASRQGLKLLKARKVYIPWFRGGVSQYPVKSEISTFLQVLTINAQHPGHDPGACKVDNSVPCQGFQLGLCHFVYGSIDVLKKVLGATLLVLVTGAGLLYFLAGRQAAGNVDRLISQAMATGEYQSITYESVEVGLDGVITLRDLEVVGINGEHYVLRKTTLMEFDYFNEVPHRLRFSIEGIGFPGGLPEPEEPGNTLLRDYLSSRMEGADLPVSIHYHYRYEPDNNRQLSNEASISLPAAGNIHFESTLRGLSLEALAQANQGEDGVTASLGLLEQIAELEIPEARLSLQDQGALGSLLDLQASRTGVDPDAFRQTLSGQIQTLALFMPPSLSTLATTIAEELNDFLEGGRTFSLAMTPAYEGNVQRLQPEIMSAFFTGDYDHIVSLLNLEIESR